MNVGSVGAPMRRNMSCYTKKKLKDNKTAQARAKPCIWLYIGNNGLVNYIKFKKNRNEKTWGFGTLNSQYHNLSEN